MTPVTYKTHILLGVSDSDTGFLIRRWEYTPSQQEMQLAIASAAPVYHAFVLVTPCGEQLPGNYVAKEPDYGYCG